MYKIVGNNDNLLNIYIRYSKKNKYQNFICQKR